MYRYLVILGLLATPALAETGGLTVPDHPEGTVSEAQGLDAWSRIEAVVTHPRCTNCHVEAGAAPMWSGPEFTPERPHGMNIQAGDSRIGAEFLPCQSCHMTDPGPNMVPHAPPHTGLEWQLAPAEFVWFGKEGAAICAQLRDPERNGGRDGAALVEHITHDAELRGFITWGFAPGGDREPAPGDLQSHLDDMAEWVAAGMPCP
ncbi:hypothetical protein ACRARG_01390 [Pseudooceanicola sp. C21-150M6]|uniref:hypothetical protein n=1 Tax=Pseudooceanicola sp. C21-150M6 TaxID=3434355 RepID=UPI003D7FF98A